MVLSLCINGLSDVSLVGGRGLVSVLVFSNVLEFCVYVRENSEKKQKTIFKGGGWGVGI